MKIEAVAPRLFRAAWKVASISRSASSESSTPRFICLAAYGQDVSLDHVAAALEVERESEDSFKPPVLFVRKAFWIELHDGVFDFAVQNGFRDNGAASNSKERVWFNISISYLAAESRP